MEIRETLRKEQRYDLADAIRKQLAELGVKIEDAVEQAKAMTDKQYDDYQCPDEQI